MNSITNGEQISNNRLLVKEEASVNIICSSRRNIR
jgi:hypothetical protein